METCSTIVKALKRLRKRLLLLSTLPFYHPALSNGYAFLAGTVVSVAITLFITPLIQETKPIAPSVIRWSGTSFLLSAFALAAISIELEKYKEDLTDKGNPREIDLKLDILKSGKRLWRLRIWASICLILFLYGYATLVK